MQKGISIGLSGFILSQSFAGNMSRSGFVGVYLGPNCVMVLL